MHDVLAALARAAATTPTPTPSPIDPDLVTPGPWGFVVIVFLTLATMALFWDMLRRIRRGRVRADINEMLEAEEQEARTAEADAARIDPDEPGASPRG